MALRYYLTIDGIAGGSTSDGHEGAFDVGNYSFDANAIVRAMQGAGAGGGRPTFSPLTVDLDVNSGMASLLNLAASGQHIPSLQLQGVSEDGQTVYDLRLGDVQITNFHDSSTGQDTMSFSYRQVSVTTTEQNADGSLEAPETFSWDVAANRSDVNIPEPQVPADGPSGADAQSYFLTIDGVAGDSVRDGHEGAFEVGDYSFDVSAIINATRGGGAGQGHTTFSPLTVDLDLNSGMASLLNLAASGRHIPSLQLQGVSADGETVYDLRLGDVQITSFHDSNTGHDMLSFSYGQVSVTTTGQNPDGSLDTPVSFSWDVAANREGANIPEPRVPAGGPTGSDAQSYFLTIDGVAGDSVRDGHEGAFEVGDYSFDVSAIINATRGGGAGQGHTTFSPLTVDLDLNSGMASLLNLAASGRHIPSLQLQGVSADGETVYDLRLGDVQITSFHDSNTGHDMLSFSYGQVSVTTTGQNPDGSLDTPVSFSWDVAANRDGANIPEPRVPAGGPTGGDAQSFYLTIDGVAGDSVRDGHEGAFEVGDYSFDVSAIINATRGGGAGQGHTTFSPLTVDLDLNSGMASLLNLAASGRHIPSLQLQGVSADGETVYDLRLGDVQITSFHDSNTGHDMLSFSYGQVSVTTTGQNPDGSLDTPVSFSWDVAANREGANIPEPRVPAGGPTGSDAQSYFLTIDGVAGDSVRDGHEGAFEVGDYSFDVSAIINATRGGGAGQGHTTFSPLTVDLDLNSGMASLLNLAASGRHIPSLQLQGVSADGETVYDLRLGDVQITSFHDSNTGHDMLSFSYGQVSVTTTGQNPDGSLDTPVSFSWDVAANRAGANIPEPRVPAGGPTGGDAQSFYLTIDGVAGDLVRDGHEGAFEVGDYSFDVSAIINATRGGGAGQGHTTFSPLTVDLDVNTGMSSFLDLVASGEHIRSLELQGVSADGETVYDLRLGDVQVTSFHDSNTGHDMLSFSYGQVSVTTTGQNADGSLDTPVTFSWDVAANREGATIPEPHVPVAAVDGGQHLLNGSEVDIVVGSPGGVLTGAHPGHDQFVFTGNFGHNEITNFSPSDHIMLERSHFGDANEILEHHATDDGHGNTIITDPHNPDNVIVLDHVSVEELDVTDFVLL